MVTDVHAHIIVPEILRELAPQESWRPAVLWQDKAQVIDFGGKQIRSSIHEFVHIEDILEHQYKAGIDRTILSPWVSLLRYEAAPQEGLRSSRIQNEGLLKIAGRFPDQIGVLGTVPLQDPELAARELAALMGESGMCGVEIAASVNGDYLGQARFHPFWAAAQATGAVIFIHPTTRGFNLPVFDEFYLWNTVGNPLETTITAAHMIMAGVLESFPKLKVILAHGGGALLGLQGRLRHAHSFQAQARTQLGENPLDSLKRFYFDALTHDPEVLRFLVDSVGADHVLLGSDYPFDMGDENAAHSLRAAGLPADDEAKILAENAAGLFNSHVDRLQD